MEISAEMLLVILFFAGLLAGGIDAIAGGGGLITIPALMLAGLSPVAALGTNKLQSMFGSGSAAYTYARAGHLDFKLQWPLAVISLIGSILGGLTAHLLPEGLFATILPFLLILIALYFAVQPSIGAVDRKARLPMWAFAITFVPMIGFYDGIFGPGTGSFFMIAFVSIAGFNLLKATASTKMLNFASNIGGFIALSGAIDWKIGLTMAAGQFIGARIGAKMAMRIGAKLIKPLLIIISLAMTARLLIDPAHPIRQYLGF